MPENDNWEGDHALSKSELKRRMKALQVIGERLVVLPQSELQKMPIDDERLLEAIQLARRIKSHSGHRRQLQYIGKLMRDIDPTPLIQAFERADGQRQEEAARFHRLESLRDTLLDQGDSAIGSLVEQYDQIDRGYVRRLLRKHRHELTKDQPLTAAKALFRYLRELDSQAE